MKRAIQTIILLLVCIIPYILHAKNFASTHTLQGATLDYPPYEYEENGVATGLAVEILQEAVSRTHIKGVDVSFYPWKRAVYSIQHGNKEVLFNAGKNKARQEWGRYSKHILILQKYYLFSRKGSKITADLTFENMRDKRIAVRAGYLYGTGPFKKAITTPNVFKEILESNSSEQSVNMLLGGRVDMFVGDFLPVMHYIINNNLADQIELVQNPSTKKDLVVLTWPTYFLFSKRHVPLEYFTEFEAALGGMIDDGTYRAIYEKYNLKYQLPTPK